MGQNSLDSKVILPRCENQEVLGYVEQQNSNNGTEKPKLLASVTSV